MQMRFDAEDEDAFSTRRDALGQQFARWLTTHHVAGDADDAALLLDWKFRYGDGALDRWTVADVAEFLLEWCPRKLAAAPGECAAIPASVAAFVEFLAHAGLLGRGSDLPAQVRRYCERNTARFVREMGDPANFGMAKRLFGAAGGLEPGADTEDLAALLAKVENLPPDVVGAALEGMIDEDDDEEQPVVGPVRLPDEQDRREAIRAARVPRQLRLLADYCASPGRPLTGKGNLRLADARHLVTALDTGDDPERGGFGTLRSAADLPTLGWLFELALAAGVVRRRQGKLVAVARFADLDETTAHEKLVRAAVHIGLSGPSAAYHPYLAQVQHVADGLVVGMLADLLGAGAAGIPFGSLADLMTAFLEEDFDGLPDLVADMVPGWVRTQFDRLGALGVVSESDENVALTPAGVPAAIALVEEADVEVLVRPDPATSDAGALVDLLPALEAQEWTRDASAWLAAQPDPATAARSLVDEACAESRDPIVVVAGLNAVAELAGEDAVDAARERLGGPHDGLILYWLADRSAIDPEAIEPLRFVAGLVDLLALALDAGGPQELLDAFTGTEQSQQLELLSGVWRLDHPRLPEVLEVIGAEHPVRAVAKAARKALVQYRSRVAGGA